MLCDKERSAEPRQSTQASSNRLCINLHTRGDPSMSPKILTRKEPTQCHICHACHAKRRWMSPSATPATRNKGRCRQVPRLPRETKVDGAKRHACHAKRRWMSFPSSVKACWAFAQLRKDVVLTTCEAGA